MYVSILNGEEKYFVDWLDFFLNPIALREAKIVCNFGLSECNRVKPVFVPFYSSI